MLKITKTEDWYHISKYRLVNTTGRFSKMPLSMVMQVVQFYYPTLDLNVFKMPSHKKGQVHLSNVLAEVFPKNDCLRDYVHPDLKTRTGMQVQFDLYYPQLNVAFEYQVKQFWMFNLRWLGGTALQKFIIL